MIASKQKLFQIHVISEKYMNKYSKIQVHHKYFQIHMISENYINDVQQAKLDVKMTQGLDDVMCDDDEVTCPGHYRCYKSHVCVHDKYLCDGVYHCPLGDDERYCHVKSVCPSRCLCHGHAFKCSHAFPTSSLFRLRYLDLSNMTDSPQHLHIHDLVILKYLNLSGSSLKVVTITSGIIHVLDLSHNNFQSLENIKFNGSGILRYFDISHNPNLLSNSALVKEFFCQLGDNLETLKLADTGITSLLSDTFHCMASLDSLDISHVDSSIQIDPLSFSVLVSLSVATVDDYVYCCMLDTALVDSDLECVTKNAKDELSSCTDLLKNHALRITLWVFAFLATFGNAGVVFYR